MAYSKSKQNRNAGKYNRRIEIYQVTKGKDAAGFPADVEALVMTVYAEVVTTKGFTLIMNQTDYEKALTRFTFRYPHTAITYDMLVKFNGKTYTIEYINNVDEKNDEIELECKEVLKVGKV